MRKSCIIWTVMLATGLVCFTEANGQAVGLDDGKTDGLTFNKGKFLSIYLESIKHRAMENPELALEVLASASRLEKLSLEQVSALAYERGKNYTLTKDFQQAIIDYELAQKHPDFKLPALANIYRLYRDMGLYELAINKVEKLAEFDQDYKLELIKLYLEFGSIDQADVLLSSLIDSLGQTPELIVINNELKKKRAQNIQTYAIQTGFEPMEQVRYLELLKKGAIKKALVSLKKIFDTGALSPEVKAQAIDSFAAQSIDEQYHESFNLLIPQLEPIVDSEIALALASYFLDRMVIDQAQKFAQTALKLEENNNEGLLLLASIYYSKENYQKGLELAELALALYPASPMCYVIVAKGHRYLGNLALAEVQILAGLDFALAGSNQYRMLHQEGSLIYLELGRDNEAKKWMDKAQ